mmetsp:Transcript_23995/g.46799  ORF Transcript_23995/g.46799 Transcript_23995/m.46799 type:complete len:384 (+) Transcript_23995:89-1240(+)|eukprot:CAMPEP_0167789710 /NCGR_PEP_ID=MMETSP0111_2-20121227/10851_1 /TAXON_ID=91324 /ORGANISM="Lotharella globosa, Strain CCCM811" /LENGTH=383 /DNA_ID=CAMNT_0007681937 /DNA_START=90 /DNA_END=1241 /DNA_ORIENTATION=+
MLEVVRTSGKYVVFSALGILLWLELLPNLRLPNPSQMEPSYSFNHNNDSRHQSEHIELEKLRRMDFARKMRVIQELVDRNSTYIREFVGERPEKFLPTLWEKGAQEMYHDYTEHPELYEGTAIILLGGARTFSEKSVRATLKDSLIDPLREFGSVHVFAYFASRNEYVGQVKLKKVRMPKRNKKTYIRWLEDLGTNHSLDFYDFKKPTEECESVRLGVTKIACLQIAHLRRKFEEVKLFEMERGKKFRHIIRFRPDAVPVRSFANAVSPLSICIHWDFAFSFPRWLADSFLDVLALFQDYDTQFMLAGIANEGLPPEIRLQEFLYRKGPSSLYEIPLTDFNIFGSHALQKGMLRLNDSDCQIEIRRPSGYEFDGTRTRERHTK